MRIMHATSAVPLPPLRRALLPAAATLALLLTSPQVLPGAGSAWAQQPDEPDTIVVENGETQPVFSYADAIREVVQVRSPVTSHDGAEPDIITVDIIRPAATEQTLQVPTIIIPSPYYSGPGRGGTVNRSGERKPTAPARPSVVAGDLRFDGTLVGGSPPLAGQAGPLVDCGRAESPGDCPEGTAGAIALIERHPGAVVEGLNPGGPTVHQQVANAATAGAVGAVVYDSLPLSLTAPVGGTTTIAALVVARADGLALRAALEDGAVHAGLRELVDPIDFFPLYYDNVFVPRGYAVALADLPGSRYSTGCLDVGGPAEAEAAVAVSEWLAGDGYAVDGTSGRPVTAHWSNGLSALIGKSWDGTIPIAAAARAPRGLATIVPIAGLSEWHSDFWDNGARYGGSPTLWHDGNNNNPSMSGRCTATRAHLAANQNDPDPGTDFWQERNWTKDAGRFTASVFVVHGMNDYNVKAVNFGRLWSALTEHDVPRKLWLSQVAHEKAFDFRREEWLRTIGRWFDHWLHGIDNGIMDESLVDVEHRPDQWTTYADWPNGDPATQLRFGRSTDPEDPRLYTLQPHAGGPDDPPSAGFFEIRRSATQLAGNPFTEDVDAQGRVRRLAFLTEELTNPVHVSGETTVTLDVSIDGANAQNTTFSALLVDYGTSPRRQHTVSGGVADAPGTTCYGSGTETDTGCYPDVQARVHTPAFEVVSRGWAQIGFQLGLDQIDPGTTYRLTFGLQHHDYVFEEGHRIGIVVAGPETHLSSGRHPTSNRPVELHLAASAALLPVVGGLSALGDALP